MTWRWREATGELSHDGEVIAHGYSGLDAGKNNPALVAATGIGPIPCGEWTMAGVYDSPKVGPFAIILDPNTGTETFGRSSFRIHGDSISHPGSASHGCVILPRPIREQIWASGDRALEVVP